MEHILQFAVNIDDDRIVKMVEEKASNEAVKSVNEKVKDALYGGYSRNNEYSPINRLIEKKVDELIVENKDYIIEKAIERLAVRLQKTKKVREKLNVAISEV